MDRPGQYTQVRFVTDTCFRHDDIVEAEIDQNSRHPVSLSRIYRTQKSCEIDFVLQTTRNAAAGSAGACVELVVTGGY